MQVVSNSRFVVFLLRDGRVCRLPIVSSAPRKKDPGHGEPGKKDSTKNLINSASIYGNKTAIPCSFIHVYIYI